MHHKIREGIVLKKICGEWLLIAVGEAADHCMYVRQINDTLAFYWQKLEQGMSEEEIVRAAQEEYDAPVDVIRTDLKRLIRDLYKKQYLIWDSVDNEKAYEVKTDEA